MYSIRFYRCSIGGREMHAGYILHNLPSRHADSRDVSNLWSSEAQPVRDARSWLPWAQHQCTLSGSDIYIYISFSECFMLEFTFYPPSFFLLSLPLAFISVSILWSKCWVEPCFHTNMNGILWLISCLSVSSTSNELAVNMGGTLVYV